MARMIPSHISVDTRSPGEIEIFRRLKDDPLTNEWTVLHSLDIASHRSQIWGEVDFVIIVPRIGVLCLEVKATKRVQREEGLWYYGNDPNPDMRGPFRQSSEAMHGVRKYLIEKDPTLSRIVFWSAVIFPFVNFEDQSPEWKSWQSIDSFHFHNRSVGQIVLSVLLHARAFLITVPTATWFRAESNEPDINQSKQIADILRPNFEFFESPLARRKNLEIELKQYTNEQFDALDAMAENPRIIFRGPAGTGKTLLAIEAARRSKQKTLLVCFNRLLGNWLKENTHNLESFITVSTLHGLMLAISGSHSPENASASFWEETLPNLALEKLVEQDYEKYNFDTLIIDEAQDIIRPQYLDFLDLILKGGMFAGNWRMFGDFEKQSLFESPKEVIELLNDRFSLTPKYSLRVNCRNTPRIADFIQLFGELDPGYSRVRRPDNNINPEIKAYKGDKNQARILLGVIDKLHREGFKNDEIIVLSYKADEYSLVSKILGVEKQIFRSFKSSFVADNIRYGTVHSFKGLEAPVVIMTDIVEVGSERSKSVFYTGVTRATSRLIVLVSDEARKEMLEIWNKQ
jgi:hypothetical protein